MNYLSLLLYLSVSAITPGPNNLMCLYLGATVKLKGARKFMYGSFTGIFVKMLLCGALNVALAQLVPVIVPYLKWIGAAYMLYLGFVMAREGFKKDDESGEKSGDSTFMSGILLQCLNVKSWVSALSVYPVYVIPYTTSFIAVLFTSVLFLVLIIISSLIWCLFGQAIQNIYKRYKLPISILMGLSLAACAVTALL